MARAAALPRLRALAAATLVSAAVGCGTGAPGAAVPATPPDRATAFCAAIVNLDMAAGAGPADIASALPSEVPSAVDSYSNVLRTLLPAVQAAAPTELAPRVATLVQLNLDASARADAGVYRTPGFLDAERAVDAAALSTCRFPELKISAKEYALQGLPTGRTPAGTTAITLTSTGAAIHAIVVDRIAGTETRPVADLVKLPADQLTALLEPVGGVRVDPGQTATVFLRLPPGRYAVLCPVRVPGPATPAPTTRPGATRTPAPPAPGPAHYTLGEFGEFVVGS